MAVRLIKAYGGQPAGSTYWGADGATLKAVGIADDRLEEATDYVANPVQPLLLRAGGGYVHTRKAQANFHTGGAAVPAQYSFRNAWALETAFDAVRLAWNSNETDAMSGFTALVAPSALSNTNSGPVTATGAAVTHTQVTFNSGGASGFAPSATGSTTAAGTIPAGSGAGVHYVESHYFSDWMQLRSLDRADAGQVMPVLYTMVYFPNVSRLWSLAAAQPGFATDPNVHNGRFVLSSFRSTFDGVTNPGTFGQAGVQTAGFIPITALQYYARNRGLAVAAVGDSITGGQGSEGEAANGFRSWGHIACARVSTYDAPVTWANWGIGGSSSPDHIARGSKIVDLYTPDVLFVQAGSINDGATTMDAAQTGILNARAMVVKCRSLGIIPIVRTIPPSSQTGSAEDIRNWINIQVRSWAADGILICDHDLALRDPSQPNRILPAFKGAADNTHPSDAGYEAMAEPARVLLQLILRANNLF